MLLITGGLGFIGSHVIERAFEEGYSIRVLDRVDPPLFLKKELSAILGSIEILKGDVSSREDVRKAMKDVDEVIHLAAISSIEECEKNPTKAGEVNIMGTINILEEMKKREAKLVFASSASVYGNKKPPLKEELEERLNPTSTYGLTKYVSELFISLFYELYGIKGISLRFFNVYGEREVNRAVVPSFIRAMLNNEDVKISGDGTQTRDFIYVKDVVEAIFKALNSNHFGESINIATGKETRIIEIFNKLKALTNYKKPPVFVNSPVGVKRSYAEVEKAKKLLNFEAKTSLEKGLLYTLNWWKRFVNA